MATVSGDTGLLLQELSVTVVLPSMGVEPTDEDFARAKEELGTSIALLKKLLNQAGAAADLMEQVCKANGGHFEAEDYYRCVRCGASTDTRQHY